MSHTRIEWRHCTPVGWLTGKSQYLLTGAPRGFHIWDTTFCKKRRKLGTFWIDKNASVDLIDTIFSVDLKVGNSIHILSGEYLGVDYISNYSITTCPRHSNTSGMARL